MKRIVVVIPHSHAWFWVQTCLTSLFRNPPRADGCEVEVIVVDNSPWSPSLRGITDTSMLFDKPDGFLFCVISNPKSNKFHASALDCVVESREFDYFMALETDVMALRPGWLGWFLDQMRDTDYAVGHWHHEQFVNPSCTLYRGDVLQSMLAWCKHTEPPDELRWGDRFEKSQKIAERQPERDYRDWYDDNVGWVVGPFADKRGWPEGTVMKEKPSGQSKGPSWYEPGQMLHHWAVNEGYTYTRCPTLTTEVGGIPVQTLYGAEMSDPLRPLEAGEMFGNAETVHLWGGTRALDIIKHDVTCEFVKTHTPYWLAREARFWRHVVSLEVRLETVDLIRKYGWHYTGQGSDHVSDRDRAAAQFVKECYEAGGVAI